MKTQITLVCTGEYHHVNVKVIVAGHALLDHNAYDVEGTPEEVRALFNAQIPQYEQYAKQKAVTIFKELIG